MQYVSNYNFSLGEILIAADEVGLIGLWFVGQKYFAKGICNPKNFETPVIKETKYWLDTYFSGKNPDFIPKIHLIGTPFQVEVWNLLQQIPYGSTVTYNHIAEQVALNHGIKRMSAQAVGGAIGRNKICLIVPCHRVIGSTGNLTGYAGGIEKKRALLEMEGINL